MTWLERDILYFVLVVAVAHLVMSIVARIWS